MGITEEFGEALYPPGKRRNGLDPELSVDLCVPRVVQPRHHPRHPEDLAGQTRDDHIGVIAARDNCQAVRTLDTSLEEHATVQAGPEQGLSRESRAEWLKSRSLIVHHGHHLATLP